MNRRRPIDPELLDAELGKLVAQLRDLKAQATTLRGDQQQAMKIIQEAIDRASAIVERCERPNDGTRKLPPERRLAAGGLRRSEKSSNRA